MALSLSVTAQKYRINNETWYTLEGVDKESTRNFITVANASKGVVDEEADHTVSNRALYIDLAHDFSICHAVPTRTWYHRVDTELPEALFENLTSFTICEPYLHRAITAEDNVTFETSVLRRVSITITKNASNPSRPARWEASPSMWEIFGGEDSCVLGETVLANTEVDIELVIEDQMEALLKVHNDSHLHNKLTAELVWELQRAMIRESPGAEDRFGYQFRQESREEAARKYRSICFRGDEDEWERRDGSNL